MAGNVPFDTAKKLATEHGWPVVLVIAIDAENGRAQFVSHGTTPESDEAAEGICKGIAELLFPGHEIKDGERVNDSGEQPSNQQ